MQPSMTLVGIVNTPPTTGTTQDFLAEIPNVEFCVEPVGGESVFANPEAALL